MSYYKTLQKLTALVLSTILVVGNSPISVAASTGGLSLGANVEITAFEELEANIATQIVPLGTSEDDLQLPKTLKATVRSTITTDDSSLDSDGIASDTEGTEIVSGDAIKMEETVPVPVTWTSSPEYDSNTDGIYLFSPNLERGYTLAADVIVPTITITVTEDAPQELSAHGMFTLLSTLSGDTQLLGLGTKEYPLRIETAAQLADFAWCLNHGELPLTLPEQPHLLLVNDIDLSNFGKGYDGGKGWIPIGTMDRPFNGIFDGNNKKITGLYINRNENFQGLFGCVGTDGIVKGLGMVNANITGEINVGAVAGWVHGTVENCYNTGNITGFSYVGGVVGEIDAEGIIENCYNTGNITITGTSTGGSAGGLVGWVSGTVQNCYNAGVVNGTVSGSGKSAFIGGVAGWITNTGTVQNCYNNGNISGIGESYARLNIGGIAGWIYGSILNCYNIGNVSSTGMVATDYVGGVVGISYGAVENCAALNQTVLCNRYAGRVAGSDNRHLLSNNHAWNAMLVNSYPVSSTDADSKDGSDFGAFQSLWTDGALNNWDRDLWILNEGKLPVLKGLPGQSDALPTYITGLAGSGDSESDPYRIYTADDLKYMADLVNSNPTFTYNKYFRLENDIDLSAYGKDYDSGKGWMPIGSESNSFTGIFNGNNKTITGLYINRTNQSYVGLFGRVETAIVQNLTLRDVSINGKDYAGGIAGHVISNSIIRSCFVTGNIRGSNGIGGIAGVVNTTSFQNNISAGSVQGQIDIGGLIGLAYSTIVLNCYSTSRVIGSEYIGGIAGRADNSNIQFCYSTGNINGDRYVLFLWSCHW